jgi:hypothetical protein
VPVGSAEDFPVDVADVVALHVLAVLREFDREPLVGRPVHAGDEPLDNQARADVERLDLRERARVQVLAVVRFVSGDRHE